MRWKLREVFNHPVDVYYRNTTEYAKMRRHNSCILLVAVKYLLDGIYGVMSRLDNKLICSFVLMR